jgi:hypothetical protein
VLRLRVPPNTLAYNSIAWRALPLKFRELVRRVVRIRERSGARA